MAEKKRKGRRAYLDDFRLGMGGEYMYAGHMYRYAGEPPYRRAMGPIKGLTAALCAAMLGAGFLPAPSMVGMGNFYVIPTFLVELVGVALSVWKAIRLIGGGEVLRAYIYEATVKKLPLYLEMTFYFALFSIGSNIVYLALNGFGGKVLWSLLLLLCHALAGASAKLMHRHLASLSWSTGEEELPLADPDE